MVWVTVNHGTDGKDITACLCYCFYCILDRLTGGKDVFNDQNSFVSDQLIIPACQSLSFFRPLFSVDSQGFSSGHFCQMISCPLRQDYSTKCWSDNDLDFMISILLSE